MWAILPSDIEWIVDQIFEIQKGMIIVWDGMKAEKEALRLVFQRMSLRKQISAEKPLLYLKYLCHFWAKRCNHLPTELYHHISQKIAASTISKSKIWSIFQWHTMKPKFPVPRFSGNNFRKHLLSEFEPGDLMIVVLGVYNFIREIFLCNSILRSILLNVCVRMKDHQVWSVQVSTMYKFCSVPPDTISFEALCDIPGFV